MRKHKVPSQSTERCIRLAPVPFPRGRMQHNPSPSVCIRSTLFHEQKPTVNTGGRPSRAIIHVLFVPFFGYYPRRSAKGGTEAPSFVHHAQASFCCSAIKQCTSRCRSRTCLRMRLSRISYNKRDTWVRCWVAPAFSFCMPALCFLQAEPDSANR